MRLNPYHIPQGFESTRIPEGMAWIIKKLKESGPHVYFVKDYHMHPPKQYWSPVMALAFRFTRYELVTEWARYLSSDYSLVPNEDGIMEIMPVKHVDVFREQDYVPRRRSNKPALIAEEASSFMRFLTRPLFQPSELKKEDMIKVYRPRRSNRLDT